MIKIPADREALLKAHQDMMDETLRSPIRGIVELDGAWAEAFGQWPIDLTHIMCPQPTPAKRDCVQCQLPFYSRSAGNVVCLICKADSDATFEGGL